MIPEFGPPAPMLPGPVLDGGKFTPPWQRWLVKLWEVLNGPTWNDINTSMVTGKVPAVNAPSYDPFVGNQKEYRFAVGDYLDLPSVEVLHDWEEGTEIEIHVHWVTGGTNDATPRGVKWEVEYSIANKQGDGGNEYFSAATLSAESTIAANEAAMHHRTVSLGTIDMTGYKIGAAVTLLIKRVASAGTAPAANPFGFQVGIHYRRGILGSRSRTTK